MIKLAALGALGYAGYRYLQKSRARGGVGSRRTGADSPRLAGGPLSGQATLAHSADAPATGF